MWVAPALPERERTLSSGGGGGAGHETVPVVLIEIPCTILGALLCPKFGYITGQPLPERIPVLPSQRSLMRQRRIGKREAKGYAQSGKQKGMHNYDRRQRSKREGLSLRGDRATDSQWPLSTPRVPYFPVCAPWLPFHPLGLPRVGRLSSESTLLAPHRNLSRWVC